MAARTRKIILTFNPAKMQSLRQPIIDLSGQIHPSIAEVSGRPGNSLRVWFAGSRKMAPFPDNCRGVFYYHLDKHLPPLAGTLRFRLIDDLSAFSTGSDLTTSIGRPWEAPLWHIARHEMWRSATNALVEEGLVEKSLLEDMKRLPVQTTRRAQATIYDIDQPMVLDLERGVHVQLVTRSAVRTASHERIFMLGSTAMSERRAAYSGIVRARFELSTLKAHKSSPPTLLLRILDLLTPVHRVNTHISTTLLPPTPGKLLARTRHPGSKRVGPKPWTCVLINRSQTNGRWREFLQETGRIEKSENERSERLRG